MTVAEVMDVASVLNILQRDHGVNTDTAFGPLRVKHYRFIAECVSNDWNTYDIARELAEQIRARGVTV